jgi:hypothetical protein
LLCKDAIFEKKRIMRAWRLTTPRNPMTNTQVEEAGVLKRHVPQLAGSGAPPTHQDTNVKKNIFFVLIFWWYLLFTSFFFMPLTLRSGKY